MCLSVVIDIINVLRVAVKTKNHPPAGPDSYSPETFQHAFQRMQLKPRQVHMRDACGGVQGRQNVPQLADALRVDAAWVVLFKQPFQPLVADCLDYPNL
jgi:hypothetical protein